MTVLIKKTSNVGKAEKVKKGFEVLFGIVTAKGTPAFIYGKQTIKKQW